MDEKLVAIKEGYKCSNKDHFYWSMGATVEASSLYRRERAYGHPQCLKILPENCQLLPRCNLEAGATLPGTKALLCPAQPSTEARHTRNTRNPLSIFLADWRLVLTLSRGQPTKNGN